MLFFSAAHVAAPHRNAKGCSLSVRGHGPLAAAVGDALWCRVAGDGSAQGSVGQGWLLTPLQAFGHAEVS